MIETLGGGRDDEQHGRLAKPDPIHDTELSERQQKILQFLWGCPSSYSPSMREIGKAGLKAQSAVGYQLTKLEAKG